MNNIIDKVLTSNNIVLLCHNNPDGDAIGSTLAMYHTLKKLDNEVDIVIKEPPKRFNFLEGFQDNILKLLDINIQSERVSGQGMAQ